MKSYEITHTLSLAMEDKLEVTKEDVPFLLEVIGVQKGTDKRNAFLDMVGFMLDNPDNWNIVTTLKEIECD